MADIENIALNYRMGAMMGGGVGLTIGFIFGSYSILRYVLILLTFSFTFSKFDGTLRTKNHNCF